MSEDTVQNIAEEELTEDKLNQMVEEAVANLVTPEEEPSPEPIQEPVEEVKGEQRLTSTIAGVGIRRSKGKTPKAKTTEPSSRRGEFKIKDGKTCNDPNVSTIRGFNA